MTVVAMNTKTINVKSSTAQSCKGCSNPNVLDFDFEYAFQPIVHLANKSIYAHEALIRGINGEGAETILNKVNLHNVYKFDQACRVKAVKTAAELNFNSLLSINFMPNAVYRPELCIRTTLEAAEKYNFPSEKIIFEFTEGERIDTNHLRSIISEYKKLGFKTAIDDFGAGYAGLSLLVQFQPDIVKIDMELIRQIDSHKPKQIVVNALIKMCHELQVTVLAEGVETKAERDYLADQGINLMQGYFFAKPSFKSVGILNDDIWI